MSSTSLIRDLLSAQDFSHPFMGGTGQNYKIVERSTSIEDGLEVIEQRDAKINKKVRHLVPAGKSRYVVEYRIPKGWARSELFSTLAQAMAFYKAHAFEATQNYRRWAESGLKSSEI